VVLPEEGIVMIQNRHPVVDQLKRAFEFLTEKHAHDDYSPLSDDFPIAAVDNMIVGKRGNVLASFPTPAMAEDVAQRLNEGEWRREEEQWAL
jgi:hypothetical protein